MSASAKPMSTRIVRVHCVHGNHGYIFARSADLSGFLASAKTEDELVKKIPDVIVRLYAASGVRVVVTMLDQAHRVDESQWIAMPADVARQALERSDSAFRA